MSTTSVDVPPGGFCDGMFCDCLSFTASRAPPSFEGGLRVSVSMSSMTDSRYFLSSAVSSAGGSGSEAYWGKRSLNHGIENALSTFLNAKSRLDESAFSIPWFKDLFPQYASEPLPPAELTADERKYLESVMDDMETETRSPPSKEGGARDAVNERQSQNIPSQKPPGGTSTEVVDI